MTEADWLACTDPKPMLEFLANKISERKRRLFGCACCRRRWADLNELTRPLIEAGERHADGVVDATEWIAAGRVAGQHLRGRGPRYAPTQRNAAFSAVITVVDAVQAVPGTEAAPEFTRFELPAILGVVRMMLEAATVEQRTAAEAGELSNLVRDVLGNPFRQPVLDPGWLVWNSGTIPSLAQTVYDDRQLPAGTLDTARLAVLSDALEDAGCADKTILDHVRDPGPHVRGCWVLDLLLGKE
jgi:YD repeat-containing protein